MYVTIDEYLWLFHFFLLILSWHSSMFHLFSKSFTFYSVPSVARPRSGSGDADQGLQFDALDRRQLVPHEPLSRNFFFVSRPRWNTRWNARWNACWNTLNLFLFCFAHSTRRSWWIWPTNRALWSSTKSPPSDWSEPSDCYRPRLSSFSYLKKKAVWLVLERLGTRRIRILCSFSMMSNNSFPLEIVVLKSFFKWRWKEITIDFHFFFEFSSFAEILH